MTGGRARRVDRSGDQGRCELVTGYHRSLWWWMSTACGALAIAVALAGQGEPGHIVEHGPTDAMFGSPQDPRTADYVQGRFG